MTRTRLALALPALLIAATVGLTACGGSSSSNTAKPEYNGKAASGPHNAADVTFAKDLFVHDTQTQRLTSLATSKSADGSQVRQIASDLQVATSHNIADAGAWLSGWSEAVPLGDTMGVGSVAGLVSDSEFSAMQSAAQGTAFDKLWVAATVKHLQGAQTEAKNELAKGENTTVKAEAQAIVDNTTKTLTSLQAAG